MPPSEVVSLDPCTGETVWRGPAAGAAEVEAAVARAAEGFRDWAARPLEARAQVAARFAELVKARREEVARLLSRETGKPFWETLTEADSVAGKAAISLAAHEDRTGESVSEAAGVRQAVRHKPHGVMAVVGPFNFPMHLPNGHIAPALIAGNAVVFKPSEKTPASGLMLAELWREAGVPEDALQVVVGGIEAGQALVAHARVDGVLFTGGLPAGRAIHQALADQPGRILALELGGNSPLVVWDAADAEAAAHLIVQSAYVSAGQRCSCARRLILPRGGEGDRVIEALLALTGRIRVGCPFDEPPPFMGPVIDNAAADELLKAQERLAGLGGRVLRPMQRLMEGKPLLSSGLIDVTDARERPDEEVFGPLLQVIRVSDFDAAVREANNTRFGLLAGLISADEALYGRFWLEIRAGVINWNRPTTGASSAAPFGGVGLSGNHRPSAYYAADYSAYPVASLETERTDFRITVGVAA
ncbi:MAG TPA: succinylglutamate-semialdehyde dehydrogenase [Caulobacteraceae bacterium]|jgi:succinylglutamic semialdehyde dehydrogenase